MDWVCYGNLTSPKIDHSYDITNWCHVSCQLKNYLSVTVWLCDWYFDLSACICIWRKTATWHWCMCPEHLWKLFHKVPWQWKQMASFQASRVYKSCENLIHFCNFGEADIVFSYFLLKEKIKDNHAPANHPSGSAWSGSIFNVDFLQHQNQPVISLVHTFARQFLIRPPGTIEEAGNSFGRKISHFVTGDQYHGETDFILRLIFHSISHTPNEFIKHFRMALLFVFSFSSSTSNRKGLRARELDFHSSTQRAPLPECLGQSDLPRGWFWVDIGAIIAILSKSEIVNYCVWIYLDSLTYLTMNLFFLSPIVSSSRRWCQSSNRRQSGPNSHFHSFDLV